MHEKRKVGVGGVGKKEGGKYDAFSRRRKRRRQGDFPPGFPVVVNWAKEQQKVGL